MLPILIFQHQPSEGPGYFAEVLARRQIPFKLVRVDAGAAVPTRADEAAALVFMGGPMSVNDPLPWVDQELALIRQAAERGMPVLGHCLGGQLIAKALGGTVTPMESREIGWHPVQQVPSSAAREWLPGLPERVDAFHWHGEMFSIPPQAVRLLRNEHCPNQAFVHGNILGLQCHVEMTAEMVHDWTAQFGHELTETAPHVQDRATLISELDARLAELHRLADALYGRWLSGLRG